MVAALPVPFRNIANSGLLLGSHSLDWLYRSPKTPAWNDANVAAAFDTASGIIANENLPLNLRLAAASAICRNCGIHTSPAMGRQCAKLLASAWSANVPVGTTQEDDILQVFSYLETDESYQEVARSLTAAWGKRVAKMDHDGGGKARISSDAAVWIAGLMAVLNDDASLQEATTGRYNDLFQSSALKLLPLLVRAGKVAEAARLVKHSTKALSGRTWSDPRTYFDQALQKHLPALLANIDDPEERILAETHLNGLQSWPFAPVLPSRETRLTTVAKRAIDIKLQRPEIRRVVYQLLAQEPATSGLLADGFIEAAELDRLDEIMKSSERYGWVRLAEEMMCCVLRAGKFERASDILQQISAKSKSGGKQYAPVWEALAKGITSAAYTHRNDPVMLARMLPITRFIAALPPDHGLSDRDRAENYTRNIFCHAQLDRMDDWLTWRNSLDPVFRKNLDAIWYPRSGWIIGMTAARTAKDTPLEKRLAVMKRILSHPEIVGPSGEIHDDAIGHLRRRAYFSPPELLAIGTELAEVIPDGGKASKAVEKLKEEAGTNK